MLSSNSGYCLDTRDFTGNFVAHFHTSFNRCLRFKRHVAMPPARLAPGLPASFGQTGLPPARFQQLSQRTPHIPGVPEV